MEKVLIVSANEKSKDTLCELLKEYNNIQIVTTTSAAKARRYAANNELSIAIINTPLREEFGTELSIDLSRLNIGTLLLVKSDIAEEIRADVESFGVLIISKPVIKSLFYQSLRLQMSVKNRLISLKKENEQLKNKIEEIKIVDRAKLILIENEHLNENEAHKYIEKEAMNRRLNRYDIAKEILDKYNIS
ncbi:ANTAR domain-containing response regulator [Anaerofustis stercorihominis]|uniref:ANTAR domain-containing response regulator n=1 Tax=Anaerofustis stercorihominis TaxID=214853 RepID=UPI00214B8132|nr:ANTAR domain-containing protein [Anaerofustis stercorihominis]MCR2032580.1 ANTAR domain-containing protein [Anaerofustis stercorihominis]